MKFYYVLIIYSFILLFNYSSSSLSSINNNIKYINNNNNNNDKVLKYIQKEEQKLIKINQNILKKLNKYNIGINSQSNPSQQDDINQSKRIIKVTSPSNSVDCRISLSPIQKNKKAIAVCGCLGSQKWINFSTFNRLRRIDSNIWGHNKKNKQNYINNLIYNKDKDEDEDNLSSNTLENYLNHPDLSSCSICSTCKKPIVGNIVVKERLKEILLNQNINNDQEEYIDDNDDKEDNDEVNDENNDEEDDEDDEDDNEKYIKKSLKQIKKNKNNNILLSPRIRAIIGLLLSYILDNIWIIRSFLLLSFTLFFIFLYPLDEIIIQFFTSQFFWSKWSLWSRLVSLPLTLKLYLGQVILEYLLNKYYQWEKYILIGKLADIENEIIEPIM